MGEPVVSLAGDDPDPLDRRPRRGRQRTRVRGGEAVGKGALRRERGIPLGRVPSGLGPRRQAIPNPGSRSPIRPLSRLREGWRGRQRFAPRHGGRFRRGAPHEAFDPKPASRAGGCSRLPHAARSRREALEAARRGLGRGGVLIRADAAIETQALTRHFRARQRAREVRALDGVDLVVHAGECFGLLGPNGAGKSTLIKILTTLLLPTSGRASVAGYDVAAEPLAVRRRINLVSGGDSSGYGILTVRETLHLFSQFYGVPRGEARRRADELLGVTGLAEKADTRLSNLSTGMRQKLNFARGFMSDPEIVFLDEPTLGLDVEASRDVRAFIARWVRERPGRTVLLTTHYMVEADELCGRVAIIDHGRILALDTPSALKRAVPAEPVFEIQLSATGDDLDPLREIRGVRSVSHHAHPATGATELRVVVDEDDRIGEVLARLKALRRSVLHLTKMEPTLETVFIHHVGRGLADEEAVDAGSA
ncbi:MAG: ABC transporter ATP-binding protein [Candidatus Latescibacteria bacterium]|nr:ABC transporter ATP-binding protein [Candidatus Latescibacterota bacterium]